MNARAGRHVSTAGGAEQHEVSASVRLRLNSIKSVVDQLLEFKRKQDLEGHPGASAGAWISFQLWKRVLQQLNTQMAEILEWENLLNVSQQELGRVQNTMQDLEQALVSCQEQAAAKVQGLQSEVERAQGELTRKESQWEHVRKDLELQANAMLEDLNKRTDVLRENEELVECLKQAAQGKEQAEARYKAAAQQVQELTKRAELAESQAAGCELEREVRTKQARELGLQLAQARDQVEQFRQLLSVTRQPSDVMVEQCRRLVDDNRRMVALLGLSAEWHELGGRMAADEGGVRYIPMHEVLHTKGGVSGLYPALEDRPVVLPGTWDGDPEDWNWVPQEAIDAVNEACARAIPHAPRQPLLSMLLAVNKIWRQHEAAAIKALHTQYHAEIRELHNLYRQRAPYEAVVGRTRLSDLKRQLRLQAMHAEELAQRAGADSKANAKDNKVLLALGLDSVRTLSKQLDKMSKRAAGLSKKLVAKNRKPPVCSSCLDNALLQKSPVIHINHQRPINARQLEPSSPASAPQQARPMLPPSQREHTSMSFAAHALPSMPVGPAPSQVPTPRPDPVSPALLASAADTYVKRAANVKPVTASAAAAAPATASGLAGKAPSPCSTRSSVAPTAVPEPTEHSPGANMVVLVGSRAVARRANNSNNSSELSFPPSSIVSPPLPAGRQEHGGVAQAPQQPPLPAGARADRLAQLVRAYEQPVLQFSLWGADGSIKSRGTVPTVATVGTRPLHAL